MMQAIALYRTEFKPSAQLAQPYVMLGFNVFAAQSDEQARVLATSMQQAFVNLRTGRPSKLQPPVPGYLESLPAQARAMLDDVLSCSAVGSLITVRQALHSFVERTGADELMITSQIFDHDARMKSYDITAHAVQTA
jgi:alkanesulfonate monooxygenase SsuD/methylene tetrahydromethanopterin reductase-like flavin-dependent oxidoreductase (luciferase family)